MAEKQGKGSKGSEPKKSTNARIVKKQTSSSVPKKSDSKVTGKQGSIRLEDTRAGRQMASDGGDLRKPKPTVVKPEKCDE